jgi:nitrite reductase (NO-forming)
LTIPLAAVACLAAGLGAWVLGVAASPAAAQQKHAVTTTINVIAGSPSELAFKLSKVSMIPAGTVVFKVTNKGKVVHDFKICSSPSGVVLNSCTGKGTKRLKPGKSQTLTVQMQDNGTYSFICTVPGHATAGMKGQIGIGVKVKAQPTTAVSSSSSSSSSSGVKPGATASGGTCANPQNTTVNVEEFDFGFRLTPATAPCGRITFVQTNTGAAIHDFVITGGGRGDRINPGQTTTMTVTMTPGSHDYLCTVEGHDTLGMVGRMAIT